MFAFLVPFIGEQENVNEVKRIIVTTVFISLVSIHLFFVLDHYKSDYILHPLKAVSRPPKTKTLFFFLRKKMDFLLYLY